jgi:spore coat protein CotH
MNDHESTTSLVFDCHDFSYSSLASGAYGAVFCKVKKHWSLTKLGALV